jgi:hypothetical protein
MDVCYLFERVPRCSSELTNTAEPRHGIERAAIRKKGAPQSGIELRRGKE